MTTDGRWLRRLTVAAIAVFAIQATATVAAYLYVNTWSLDAAARIYASPRVVPGASMALRAMVIDTRSARPVRHSGFEVELVTGDETFGETTLDAGHGLPVWGHLVAPESAATVRANERGNAKRARMLSAVVEPTDVSWLGSTQIHGAQPSRRVSNVTIAGADAPQLRVRRPPQDDPCTWNLTVAASGGVVARGLSNRVFARLSRGDGTPAAGVAVSVQSVDGLAAGLSSRALTDTSGLAELRMRPDGNETWALEFDCDGTPTRRELVIVPTWDGIVVSARSVSFESGEPLVFDVSHQRAWGQWHQDIWCDGAWIATQSTGIRAGDSQFTFPAAQIPVEPDGLRLCLLQGYLFVQASDPPRSVVWFLVRGFDVDAAEAIDRLVAAVDAHGSSSRPSVEADANFTLTGRDDLERLGRWSLANVPHPFFPQPLLVDDAPAAADELMQRRHEAAHRLLAAMALDALVIAVSIAAFIVPRARAQQRRLREVATDELGEGALDGLLSNRRAVGGLFVGVLAIGASLLGLGVLFSIMR